MPTENIQILGWWPVAAGCAGCFAAAFAAIRYRIPDLTRRIETLETKNPSKSDLDTVIDSFHTVCKFNQATCQKANALRIERINRELDKKLSAIYDIINKQAVTVARIDERVAVLLNNHKNGNKFSDRAK